MGGLKDILFNASQAQIDRVDKNVNEVETRAIKEVT